MKREFIAIISLTTSVLLLSTCDRQSNNSFKNKLRTELTDSIIIDMLERLDFNEDPNLNIHISRPEYLSASSAIITVVQDRRIAEDENELKGQLNYKDHKVFIHRTFDDKTFWTHNYSTHIVLFQRLRDFDLFYSIHPLAKHDTSILKRLNIDRFNIN